MKMNDTLKYRNIWLGCAMIWIVLYHTEVYMPISLLRYFKGMGYGGVDICLFASGIGCYFSLNKDSDIIRFFKRRFVRIAPTYWCFIGIWFIYRALIGKFKLSAVVGNVLGIQSLTGLGNEFNWYISALIVLYILAPIFKEIVDKSKKKIHNILMVSLLLVISQVYWGADKFIIIATRVPIFYIGMIYAKKCCDEKELKGKDILLYIITMIVGIGMYFLFQFEFKDYLWKYGLYWYPFILITPGICMMISLVMSILERVKWCGCIKKILELVGEYSFEIYLVHMLVFKGTKYLIETMSMVPNINGTWFVSSVIVVCGCVSLRNISQKAEKIIIDKNKWLSEG